MEKFWLDDQLVKKKRNPETVCVFAERQKKKKRSQAYLFGVLRPHLHFYAVPMGNEEEDTYVSGV